jgi:hypothetical protein
LSDKKQLNLEFGNRIVKKTLYVLERVFIVELTQLMLLGGHGSYTENFPPNTLYQRKIHEMRKLFLPKALMRKIFL